MIPKARWSQYGEEGMVVKGITIHNTGNNLSAKENAELMANSQREYGCHFFIDEGETVQMMPEDWHVWHTGKAYDGGNMSTIAIEICRSTGKEETYLQAQKRAVRKIKNLMNKYGIDESHIYFHRSWNSGTYCPHRILQMYGNIKRFIEEEF